MGTGMPQAVSEASCFCTSSQLIASLSELQRVQMVQCSFDQHWNAALHNSTDRSKWCHRRLRVTL
eukprot:701623-Amphidinium_carterae.1